jgi:hypothetical protein
MSSSSEQDTHRPRTVSYGTDDFDQAVAGVEETLRSGEGIVFLFIGASKEEKREGLAKVSIDDELNLHRFKVPNLIGEGLKETQGHLREAFDHADEDAAVLFFDEADVLLDPSQGRPDATPETDEDEKERQKEEEKDAALSDYFFDRVEAYPGASIICFSSPQFIDRLEGHDADVIVEF